MNSSLVQHLEILFQSIETLRQSTVAPFTNVYSYIKNLIVKSFIVQDGVNFKYAVGYFNMTLI